MSGIELSAGYASNIMERMLRSAEQVQANNAADAGLLPRGYSGNAVPSSRGEIFIMKGAVPTDFTGITGYSSRSADILVPFKTDDTWQGKMTSDFLLQNTVNPIVLSSLYATATASGTATWFWWVARLVQSGFEQNTLWHQIIGSVGVTGSGADMEIPNVNIVSGLSYRLRNIRVTFPTSWSY